MEHYETSFLGKRQCQLRILFDSIIRMIAVNEYQVKSDIPGVDDLPTLLAMGIANVLDGSREILGSNCRSRVPVVVDYVDGVEFQNRVQESTTASGRCTNFQVASEATVARLESIDKVGDLLWNLLQVAAALIHSAKHCQAV